MSVLPIVDRELRVAARRKGTYWMRACAAMALLAIWLCMVLFHSQTAAQISHSLEVLTLIMAILAGVFLTSDSLSEEKREGTLGLLFLTDLKAYDVVLGKMVAHALHAFFGLVAVLPMLALPILMGGVTGREFTREVLALMITLFFSLSVGMGVSAICREARQAIAMTFLLMLVFTGVFPALWWFQRMLVNSSSLDFLLWASPAYAFREGIDDIYKYGKSAWEFWSSLTTCFSLGLLAIVVANLYLPHAWQERSQTSEKKKKGPPLVGLTRRTAPVSPFKSFSGHDPALWLAVRDPWPRNAAWKMIFGILPIWAGGMLIALFTRWGPEAFSVSFLAAYGMHFVVKVLIATEASRRMNHDRRSGAWELLLVTPLKVKWILEGQQKALKQHFRGAIIMLCLVNLAMVVFTLANEQQLKINWESQWMFNIVFCGGAGVLLTDFYALSWVGMWRGLKMRQHHVAVILTVIQVLAPPLLVAFLLMSAQPAFNSIDGPMIVTALWFGMGMALDLAAGMIARRQLRREFRAAVLAVKQ